MGATANSDYRDGNSKINKMYLGTSLIYARPLQFGIFTGGNISYTGDYKVHTFLSSGDFVIVEPGNYDLEYLIVGGGGGGGYSDAEKYAGGGGGGGGVITGEIDINTLNKGNYPVVVGVGGITSTVIYTNNPSTPGGNSSFNLLVAYGGGRGGDYYNPLGTYRHGGVGGCGGGGLGASELGASSQGSGGVGLQGFNGGSGTTGPSPYRYGAGGGGGGMGEAGQTVGGPADGGNGISSSISGSVVYYGGGGAGVYHSVAGNGGLGGGGGNGHISGYPNTGGGGSGGKKYLYSSIFPGGGGSGIVIIRYKYK